MSKEFVDAMQAGNNLEAEAVFKDAIAKKVGDSLELKRKDISKAFVSNYKDKEANDADV